MSEFFMRHGNGPWQVQNEGSLERVKRAALLMSGLTGTPIEVAMRREPGTQIDPWKLRRDGSVRYEVLFTAGDDEG
jgi:hypothetical protein